MDSKPKVKLSGKDGNYFSVMANLHKAAKKAKWPEEKWESFCTEAKSGDYDNMLKVACKHFEVS